MRKRQHLRQVRHRPFAAVVLPVGVGDEADRRIEREIGRHRRLSGRIELRLERQHVLQAQDHIDNEEATGVEQQHGDCIGQPMLLAFLVDAAGPVHGRLDRPQQRRKERALAVEDARHVGAEHRRDSDDDRAVKQDLNPPNRGHDTSLGFRARTARVAAERR